MAKTIIDKLAVKDKFQKRVLRDYVEKLDRVFQIIYELDLTVDWTSIERCSPVSNFAVARGSVVVPENTKIKNMQGEYVSFEDQKLFDAGFMFPLSTLDECTPYQIAEYVHQMKMLQVIATQEEFQDLLHSPEFDAENIQEYLPSDVIREPKEEEEVETETIEFTVPEKIAGFDLKELNDEQVLSLMINMMGGTEYGDKQ